MSEKTENLSVMAPGAQPLAVRDSESEALGMIERAARDPAVDITKFERLVALRNQERAFLAEQRFNEAMNSVQALNLRVKRESRNSHTNSTYAKLEALNAIIVPAYSARGFAISFGTADCPIKDHYRLVCDVSNAGHTKRYQCDLPLDVAGPKGGANKAAIQGFGSTMSYGRRYLTKLIFNVCETDEDDDGQAAANQKPAGPMKATPKTRLWFLALIKDIHVKAQAYAIDKGYIMPDQGLEEWSLDSVPCDKHELAALRKEIEAHP